jgi:S1-C subfamily serine protease
MIKRSLIALVVLALYCPAVALPDTEKLITVAAQKTDGALAVLSFTLMDELGERPISGQAMCIRPSGLFMSFTFNPAMRPDKLKDFKLTLPGLEGRERGAFDAKLVGIDPETGIGFVQALGEHRWPALELAEKANLRVGQPVISAGIMPPDTGNARYFGVAYVSTTIRVPEPQVYVTGGKLTSVGSAVLAADGRVVGFVHRQRALKNLFVPTGRGALPVRTSGQQETSFFAPIDDFRHVLANPGRPRKLSWIGVINFSPVGEATATTRELDKPGVKIAKIVPGTPAGQAKLEDQDVIVGINGRPLEQLGNPELTTQNFERFLIRLPVGTELKLSIFRDGRTFDITLKTAPIPKRRFQAERYYSTMLGLGVRERVMLDEYLEGGPSAKGPGVIVYAVRRGGRAHTSRISNNDLIVSFGGTPVTTVEAFKQAEQRILDDKSIKEAEIEFKRDDRKEMVRVRLPSR